MNITYSARHHFMYGISLIMAPLLQAVSSFFWINGEYGVTGGTILVFSMIFWIPALISLFSLVKDRFPNYAAWGLLVAIYGFISGVNFGFAGVFTEVFNIAHEKYIQELAKYPIASNLLLFQAGPLAPLSLIVLGIVLLRNKTVDFKIALLIIIGGIAFPISRISRIEWVAHIADLLLFVPLSILGMKILLYRTINQR
jgi:hypothetical protein